MTRQRKPTLLEEIVRTLSMNHSEPSSQRELMSEILAIFQAILDCDEDTLHSYGMPKDKRITREIRIEAVQYLFRFIASRNHLSNPNLAALLTDEDVDNLALPLSNYVERYSDFIYAGS
jgi:hypothetical protein